MKSITLTSERIVIARIETDRQPNEQIVRQLMPSIQALGLLQPILIHRPGHALGVKLIFGANRLEAVRRLGDQAIQSRVLNGDDDEIQTWIEQARRDENEIRLISAPLPAGVINLRTARQSRR